MGSAVDNSLGSEAEKRSATCDSGHTENQKATGRRVTDVIVDYISALGVKHIFGVGGANIEDLYDAAFFNDDLSAVLAKHEFSAATMADGYSRAGNGLGVVAATSGGGSLNSGGWSGRVTGKSGSGAGARRPAADRTLDGRGSFQDTSGHNGALDAEALFSAVSVYCERVVDPSHIYAALPRGGRCGPYRRPCRAAAAQGHPAEQRRRGDARIHRNATRRHREYR